MDKVELYENIYDKKFSFGKNWNIFLKGLSKKKILLAKKSLSDFIGLKDFKGKFFIDIGCGSGLFSLCAILLGSKKVISVDVDENSINCAKYLREKYNIDEKIWVIKKGSALDEKFISGLGKGDIIYSWGVLHHTGNMWKALKNIDLLLKKNSLFYIAIYNDFKGFPFNSITWVKIKYFYSSSNFVIRKILEFLYINLYILGLILTLKNPFKYIKNYEKDSIRGMTFFIDVKDWLGGYPYEYASVKKLKSFYNNFSYDLKKVKRTKREGCNEFLFIKK